ncbi:disease resistance protein (TIR-NBS-LRR class) [Medicago truncatula]|uniref:ADP-ribosyl cyclase/cyclic ADP-ribose hydrolase n=1 Tax=Medicago truncatula TaxID=3880 RepID=G7JLU5_MEDTR|nr:disease resistance protein (TIR-NBS-LRR class) [Medicago truncatula]
MAQPMQPSLSSFTCDWTYDVFLSFRGIDTRNNFTGNLYNSLNQRGIKTFFDEQEIQKGEEITHTLLQEGCFCRFFYDVDPSHVRKLNEAYAEAFAKHEVRFRDEKNKVQKWRDALYQAANMSGWHFPTILLYIFVFSINPLLFELCYFDIKI